MDVIFYASYCMEKSVFGFSNFVFEVPIKALFNVTAQYRVVVLSVPGYVKVDLTVDVLRHLAPQGRPLKRPELHRGIANQP
jgi:hypothetical protein